MKLTLQTDLAFRVLMLIAGENTKPISVTQMALKLKVSQHHLSKVVKELTTKGFLISTRGRLGGVLLARAEAQIKLSDVIIAVEPDFHIAQCFGNKACVFLPQCKLKKQLSKALKAFIDVLDKQTLADIL